MYTNLIDDIDNMHTKFGVHDWVAKKVTDGDWSTLLEFLKFRIKFLKEELDETSKAVDEHDAEEVVDGCIDLIVVALGTLNAFGINEERAWKAVHVANMRKEPGVKPERPNILGLPDLIKPSDWVGPSHKHNHGILGALFENV